jgi:ClpP class serine protease
MAKQMGIKVQVFSSGAYKGMGTRGTALSEKQAAFLQGRIMEIAEMFYDHVRNSRGEVADEDMQGQYFKGAAAADKGLIDKVVADLDEVMAIL